MKRIKIAGILLGLLILLSQCTDTPSNTLNDNPSKFQSQYNPEAFTNVIPYPFTVNWQEGEKGYSKELESTYYEYPLRWTTDFNPDALAKRHPNRLTYKLLAVPGANDGLTFYLLKFLGSGDTQSPDLQWKSPTTFTGRVYLINTDNERLLAQQYKKGDLIGNINKITKEEFQAFTEGKQRMAEDCYTITTYHYTDWYRLYADGTMEFLDRQLNDVSHGTVCMGGGSGGGPIGGGGGTGGPGSGGTGGGGGTGGLGSGGTGGGGDDSGDPVHGCSGRDEIDDKVVTWDENLILNIPDPGDIINSIDNYLTCFNNKQDAKINIYIDQPTPNSRDTWSGSALNPNVGHTFISIQQGSITRVFGFYPTNGINPFTNPSGNSSLIDDSNHSYDVKVSKRITSSQLSVILSRTKNYNSIYNLNDYNCTDFAIEIGNSAGISLPSSSGNWPGGSGSNPGDLGEDVRAMSPNSNITINTGGGTAVSNTGSCN